MTTEELEQIGKIIEAKLEAERDHTKNIVREEVQASEQRLSKKIDVSTGDIAGFFHKTWEKMDETNQETNERLTIIEDHLGLDRPPKNN